jgi:hypothetical protein
MSKLALKILLHGCRCPSRYAYTEKISIFGPNRTVKRKACSQNGGQSFSSRFNLRLAAASKGPTRLYLRFEPLGLAHAKLPVQAPLEFFFWKEVVVNIFLRLQNTIEEQKNPLLLHVPK